MAPGLVLLAHFWGIYHIFIFEVTIDDTCAELFQAYDTIDI
jgi:hypothetical protein